MTPPDTKQLIERVARTLHRQANINIQADPDEWPWEEATEQVKEWNRSSAAAAIAALQQPDERDEVIAWLRAEAVEARNLSHCETVESQRMYRIGQHDALMLASDAIERGVHRTALGEG
jgi:hypothetical protein